MKKVFLFIVMVFLCGMACNARIRQYKVNVVREYVHDDAAYTQGLFFDGGQMYESTGQYGQSSFRKVDYLSGKVLKQLNFSKKYFGEGSVMLDGKLYILTWMNKVAFVYDAKTLEYKQSFSYPREGWGLTTDGKYLYASDGTSKIYVLDTNFKLLRSINVTGNGKSLRYLNELEWIDGKIWANIYTTDLIAIIDPETGDVEGMVDCSGLLPEKLRTENTDVLNGIAYNPETGQIFITGKNWKRLYEITIK